MDRCGHLVSYTFVYGQIQKKLLPFRNLFTSLFLAVVVSISAACVNPKDTVDGTSPGPYGRSAGREPSGLSLRLPNDQDRDIAQVRIKDLSLGQRIGQMLIIHLPWTHDGSKYRHLTAAEKALIRDLQPGGVVLYGVNISTLDQVRDLCAEISELCTIRPFIALDEEGGRVSRLNNILSPRATKVPPAATLAASGPYAVKTAYAIIGMELAIAGINMDFAPVADVPFETESDIIGDRALGDSFDEAGGFVVLAAEALADHGVVPVLKHFPGHGRSKGDTHKGIQTISVSWEDLSASDLKPFREAFAAGVPALMTAHISYPMLDESGLPASISRKIVTERLRGDLSFQGLVITDALDMQGIIEATGSNDPAIEAIQAGADMLLSPTDPAQIRRQAILAVNSGTLDPALIEKAAERILVVKQIFGVLDGPSFWNTRPDAIDLFGSVTSERILSRALKGGFVVGR